MGRGNRGPRAMCLLLDLVTQHEFQIFLQVGFRLGRSLLKEIAPHEPLAFFKFHILPYDYGMS